MSLKRKHTRAFKSVELRPTPPAPTNTLTPLQSLLKDNQEYSFKIRCVSASLNRNQSPLYSNHQQRQMIESIHERLKLIKNAELSEQSKEHVIFDETTNSKSYTVNCTDKRFPLTIKVNSPAIAVQVFISSSQIMPDEKNSDTKYQIRGTRLICIKQVCQELHMTLRLTSQVRTSDSLVDISCWFANRRASSMSDISSSCARGATTYVKTRKEKIAERQRIEKMIEEARGSARIVRESRMMKSRLDFISYNKNHLLQKITHNYESAYCLEKKKMMQFEKEKELYIRQISKMNSQFPEKLRQHKEKHEAFQMVRVRHFATFTLLTGFLRELNKRCFQYGEILMRTRRVELTCKLFLRKLKTRMRRRMHFGTKVKLTLLQSLGLTAGILAERVDKKASKVIKNVITRYSLSETLSAIKKACQEYRLKVTKIQKYFKKRHTSRVEAFSMMQQRIVGVLLDRFLKHKQEQRNSAEKALNGKLKLAGKKMYHNFSKECLIQFKRQKLKKSAELTNDVEGNRIKIVDKAEENKAEKVDAEKDADKQERTKKAIYGFYRHRGILEGMTERLLIRVFDKNSDALTRQQKIQPNRT